MELDFTLVGCGTWVLNVDNKFKIGCDPALAPAGTKHIYKGLATQRVKSPVYSDKTFANTKIWILSHSHFDHIDKAGLKMIPVGAKVVCNKNCEKILKNRTDLEVNSLDWNSSRDFNIDGYQISITSIPAFHGMNWFARFLMGGVSGYLIAINNGSETKTIYATSDTVHHQEIISALKNQKIDLMIANQGNIKPKMPGGPFTMNMDMLDNFIRDLKPATVLPIHIDDYSHFGAKPEQFKERFKVLTNGETIKI